MARHSANQKPTERESGGVGEWENRDARRGWRSHRPLSRSPPLPLSVVMLTAFIIVSSLHGRARLRAHPADRGHFGFRPGHATLHRPARLQAEHEPAEAHDADREDRIADDPQ